MLNLIILRGAPGSGKSTFCNKLIERYKDYVVTVCSNDQFMFEDGKYKWSEQKLNKAMVLCFIKCIRALEDEHEIIVIDNTNLTPKYYEKYIIAAEFYGYKVYFCHLKGEYQNIHGVSETQVNESRSKYYVDNRYPYLDPDNIENLFSYCSMITDE